jgi:hypothetical protein
LHKVNIQLNNPAKPYNLSTQDKFSVKLNAKYETSEQIKAFDYSPAVIISTCNCDADKNNLNISRDIRRILKELINKIDRSRTFTQIELWS